jgi:hypothetical protein
MAASLRRFSNTVLAFLLLSLVSALYMALFASNKVFAIAIFYFFAGLFMGLVAPLLTIIYLLSGEDKYSRSDHIFSDGTLIGIGIIVVAGSIFFLIWTYRNHLKAQN